MASVLPLLLLWVFAPTVVPEVLSPEDVTGNIAHPHTIASIQGWGGERGFTRQPHSPLCSSPPR